MSDFVIPVDESVERALREESLDGRLCLLDDIRGGIHARNVISEMNHQRQLKAIGEQTWTDDDIEMRLDSVMHGAGYHALGLQYGFECWDDDDFIRWRNRKFPETKIHHKPRRTSILVAGKYSPPRA